MPASELLEWMEYESLEPFGAIRDNWHSATIAHILANVHRDPKKPPIAFSDFMYRDHQSIQEEKARALIAFMDSRSEDGH